MLAVLLVWLAVTVGAGLLLVLVVLGQTAVARGRQVAQRVGAQQRDQRPARVASQPG